GARKRQIPADDNERRPVPVPKAFLNGADEVAKRDGLRPRVARLPQVDVGHQKPTEPLDRDASPLRHRPAAVLSNRGHHGGFRLERLLTKTLRWRLDLRMIAQTPVILEGQRGES